jgi:hypothetical protein
VAKLNLTIEEGPLATGLHPLRYTRPIVVAHAPALFLLPCGDPRCVDGGYDLTRAVLSGLASHAPRFSGECACEGSVGSSACGRKLRFLADADYASELAAV